MTADRPPVKQATNAESRYEQHKNQQGHGHEPAEAHPGPENEVDSFQDNELAPHQHHQSNTAAAALPTGVEACRNRALTLFLATTTTSRTAFNKTAVSRDRVKVSLITFGKCSTNRLRTTTYTNTSTTAAAPARAR